MDGALVVLDKKSHSGLKQTTRSWNITRLVFKIMNIIVHSNIFMAVVKPLVFMCVPQDVEDTSPNRCAASFKVLVVSSQFEGKTLLQRHRYSTVTNCNLMHVYCDFSLSHSIQYLTSTSAFSLVFYLNHRCPQHKIHPNIHLFSITTYTVLRAVCGVAGDNFSCHRVKVPCVPLCITGLT